MLSVVIFVFAIFAIAFIFKDMSENIQIFFVQKRRWHIHDELWQRKTTKLDAQISNHGTRISQDGKRFFYLDDTDNSLNYVELSFGWKTGVVDKVSQELHDKPIRKYSLLHKGQHQQRVFIQK